MSLVQNYIGLDARIYAIVQSLLNGETIDLSDYYTKEEVDALIASGGTGTTINYNDLSNRPIIDGLLQSNLDLNGKLLLYNGKQLYLPEFNKTDSTVMFSNDCVIPNIYTKAECDEKFTGGGGGTTDYNALTNKPIDNYVLQNNLDCGAHDLTNINNIYTKTECDEKYQLKVGSSLNINSNSSFSENAANQNACLIVGGKDCWYNTNIVSARNTFMSVGGDGARVKFWDAFDWSWLAIGPTGDATGEPYINGRGVCALTIGPLRNGIDIRWNYTYDDEGNINGGNPIMRINNNEIFLPEKSMMQYDSLTQNILFSKYIHTPGIASKRIIIPNIAELYYYNVMCEEDVLKLIAYRDLLATFNNSGIKYFAGSDKLFSITRDVVVDKITSANTALELACNTIALTGNDTDGRIVLSAKDIMFNGTLNNVYTKTEVDALIASGGGGGTGNYHGPVTNSIVESSGYGRAWILNYTQSAPIDKYGLLLTTNEDNDNATGLIYDYTRKTIGFGNLSNLANTPGLTYKTDTDLLSVGKLSVLGNIDAESIVASVELSAPNIYTKTEVDNKITTPKQLSMNAYSPTINLPNEYNAGIIIGGNTSTYDVTGASRLNGGIMMGGQNNIATVNGGNTGVIICGGFGNNVQLNQAYQGVLVIGGHNNGVTLQNKLDALLDVGPGKGFRFHWDNPTSKATMYMNGKTVNIQYSQTITHEAPYAGDITEYAIGDPVFATGRVCKYVPVKDADGNITGGEWSYTTSAMDCICELKPEGQIGEFVGIWTAYVSLNLKDK